jgi:hypothetical protein
MRALFSFNLFIVRGDGFDPEAIAHPRIIDKMGFADAQWPLGIEMPMFEVRRTLIEDLFGEINQRYLNLDWHRSCALRIEISSIVKVELLDRGKSADPE